MMNANEVTNNEYAKETKRFVSARKMDLTYDLELVLSKLNKEIKIEVEL